MIAEISVKLRKGVLDPAGQATLEALRELGFASVDGVRIGRLIEVQMRNASEEEARTTAQAMGDRLLANSVIEDFSVHIRKD